MVWTIDKYGFAEDLSDVPARELDKRFPDGRGLYATLAGVAQGEGIRLSAFAKPIHASHYYDGQEAMLAREEGRDIESLTPVDIKAHYWVEFFDGEIRHPPLRRCDAQNLGYAKMLEETGERLWHIAALDSAELTIFYAAEVEDDLADKLEDATLRLHPDSGGIYDAPGIEDRLTVTQGTVRAAKIPSHAALLRAEDGSARFFGAEDLHELQGEVLGVLTKMTDAEGDMFDLAEAAGLRIEVGYLWLSDGLVDEAIRQRAERKHNEDPSP